MQRMSVQERARAIDIVKTGRSLREACFSLLYLLFWLWIVIKFLILLFTIDRYNLN
jgi:hypothetical protein